MVTRLGEGVWWIDLRGVNAYVVDNGALTLVDAGFPWSGRQLAGALAAVGEAIADVERVLLTHYDIDHVGALSALAPFDVTVYIGREDAPFLTRERRPPVQSRKGLLQRAVDWLRSVPELSVELVDDGDEIGQFQAYHTGGHTAGHTVYASEALDVAFLGDLVMESGGRLVPTPWLICEDHRRMLEAIKALEKRLPPFEIAAVGHGVPFVEGGDRRLSACAARR